MKMKNIYFIIFVIGVLLFVTPLFALEIFNPSTISTCDSTTGWSAGSGFSVSLDTTVQTEGSGCIQITTGSGAWHPYVRYASTPFGMSSSKPVISIPMRGQVTNYPIRIQIYYYYNNHHYYYEVPTKYLLTANEWNVLEADFSIVTSGIVYDEAWVSSPTTDPIRYESINQLTLWIGDGSSTIPSSTLFWIDNVRFGSPSSSPTPTPSASPTSTPTPTATPSVNEFQVTIVPTESTIAIGGSETFVSNVLNGAVPYTYQWYVDGAVMATTDSYSTTSLSEGDHEIYLVVTDNNGDTATSNVAILTVTTSDQIPTPTPEQNNDDVVLFANSFQIVGFGMAAIGFIGSMHEWRKKRHGS